MEQSHVIILRDTLLGTCSIYDLMRHLAPGSSYVDSGESALVYPIHLALDEGLFSKDTGELVFPQVGVRQEDTTLALTCTCASPLDKVCIHQMEVLDAILKRDDYRIFFDDRMRDTRLRSLAKGYGLDREEDMDVYFQLQFEEGQAVIFSKQRELFRVDHTFLKQSSFERSKSTLPELVEPSDIKKWILVLSKHRFYEQTNFLLFEAELTQQGKLKNPLTPVDLARQLLQENTADTVRFLTALLSYQNRFESEANDTEILALKIIASNPMKLDVYYHDRSRSESIVAKSLFPVKLAIVKPELKLKVLKKEPFYEINSALFVLDTLVPISELVLKNDYFIFFKQQYIYVPDPDLLRVIRFLKSNNETLLVHSSKYDAFEAQFLTPIEGYVDVEYAYIHKASPAQVAGTNLERECLLYLQKEGTFISLTPVVRYGDSELPVYSRKQLYIVDAAGNRFKGNRDTVYEDRFTAAILSQHPDFEEQLHYAQYFYLHKDKFFDDSWFLSAFEAWRQAGITILGFQELGGTGINPYTAKVDIKINSGKDWFNVHVKVNFGGQVARMRQVQRAFRNKSRFVKLDDGTLGVLPDEWMNKISKYFSMAQLEKELLHIPKIRFSEVESHFESDVLSTEVREELTILRQDFLEAAAVPKVESPRGLQTVLRDYQQEGFSWLCFLDRFKFGGCLADDMGLGKTVQVIAFLLYLKEKASEHPHLIVLPTSLLFNWEDELARFAPDLRVLNYNGMPRSKKVEQLTNYDVILVSYGVLSSDIGFFRDQSFGYVFLDEAQLIKNPNSERYKTVCVLKSTNRIVMTGTPVENSTFDIYGLFSFACPGLLGNKQFFKDTYAIPIDQFEFKQRALELEEKIAPFILRRTKRQVVHDLPEKTESVIYCDMNEEQRTIYAAYEEEVRNYINGIDSELLDQDRLHVLASLTRLRQVCNSPALLQNGYSAANSVKIDVLLEQIMDKMKGHKILVFSQFVGMLDLIKERLHRQQIAYSYLTGQSKNRKSIVADFQENESVRVFLISLKAGGLGLNLTGADYVYLVDPWWNPAVENQAIDRSYRIGQDKKVTAVRLICTNTIEEKIIDLKQRKQKLASNLVGTDANWFNSLSKEDLLALASS